VKIYKENKEICAKCSGRCCKHVPGVAFPGYFNYNKNRIEDALKSKLWIVLGNDMINNLPYVQPAQDYNGACVFLRGNGCKLVFKDRPLECKTLKPIDGGGCKHNNRKSDRNAAAKKWYKYLKILSLYA
jgi:Fe-S-cluster containining protein